VEEVECTRANDYSKFMRNNRRWKSKQREIISLE
jgi:hypothetical protein